MKNTSLRAAFQHFNLRRYFNDQQLLREFDEDKYIPSFYFDTSSIIDMMVGLCGLLQNFDFDQEKYESLSTLVHTLAYNNLLGKIKTLPPHTDEFIRKVRTDTQLFGDYVPGHVNQQIKVFWDKLSLQIRDMQSHTSNGNFYQGAVNNLEEECDDIFKGTYLIGQDGNWKARYRYLVKNAEILNFTADENYNFETKELLDKKLHGLLYAELNRRKPQKESNNYADALALTLLHERLVKAKQTPTVGKKFHIPIFFSDQQDILDVVRLLAQREDEAGNPYFTFVGTHGRYCIVRDGYFFVLKGIYEGLRQRVPQYNLNRFLEQLRRPLSEINKSPLSERGKVDQISTLLEADVEESSVKAAILDFFAGWWQMYGKKATEQIFASRKLSPTEQRKLEEEVNSYIDKEKQALRERFGEYTRRSQLLRQTLRQLSFLHDIIQELFAKSGKNFDAYLEFAPRFYCNEKLCQEIQESYNDIYYTYRQFVASGQRDARVFSKYQLLIINDLLCGIYDRADDDREKFAHLVHLANKSVALLWILFSEDQDQVKLIVTICEVVRERYEKMPHSSGSYPHVSFALFHAGAILKSRNRDEAEVLKIIDCINSKYAANFYVNSGLSYLYCTLWRLNTPITKFIFPEQYLVNYKLKPTDRYALDFLKQANGCAKKTLDYLYPIIHESTVPTVEILAKQRIYYYALNIYIFTTTYLASTADFLAIQSVVEQFKDVVNSGYWQHGNYDDTLAVYHFRYAIIADEPAAFNFCIKEALQYAERAVRNSKREVLAYENIRSRIAKTKANGYHKLTNQKRVGQLI